MHKHNVCISKIKELVHFHFTNAIYIKKNTRTQRNSYWVRLHVSTPSIITKWPIVRVWHNNLFYPPTCEQKWTNVSHSRTQRSTRHWLPAVWGLRAPNIRLDSLWREASNAKRRVNISVKVPVRTAILFFLYCWLFRLSFLLIIHVCTHFYRAFSTTV